MTYEEFKKETEKLREAVSILRIKHPEGVFVKNTITGEEYDCLDKDMDDWFAAADLIIQNNELKKGDL